MMIPQKGGGSLLKSVELCVVYEGLRGDVLLLVLGEEAVNVLQCLQSLTWMRGGVGGGGRRWRGVNDND